MEQEPGQDPENDGPAGPQPPPVPPIPAQALPGPATLVAAPRRRRGADAGTGDDGESVFGPWDALEGTLGAAREREELLAGFAPGGVWDRHARRARSWAPPSRGRPARIGGAAWRPGRSWSGWCGRWRRSSRGRPRARWA